MKTIQFTANNGGIDYSNNESYNYLFQQLDHLGSLSGEAQELKVPITTLEKFSTSDHSIIFIIDDHNPQSLQGYLKYGYKDLYFYTSKGKVIQKTHCLCLLDFYVLETVQRKGCGKLLFDNFLSAVNTTPEQIAYDRPSKKLLPFLQKHYHLISPDHQPNRYTIYPEFIL